MSELWKKLTEYPEYEVSNCGNVRKYVGTLRGEDKYIAIRTFPGTNQYLNFNVWSNSEHMQFTVHRKVAELFVKNADPTVNKVVNHINHNKFDNRAENLEWTTQYLNMSCLRKAVLQFSKSGEYMREWESTSAPHNTYPSVFRSQSGISGCCLGKTRTAYGYIWKFKSETPQDDNGVYILTEKLAETEKVQDQD